MKQRIITDNSKLPLTRIMPLIRALTAEFGNPKIVKLNRTSDHVPYFHYKFQWNLKGRKMKFTQNSPKITIYTKYSRIYCPTSSNPASLKLFRRDAKVSYHGHNGKNYNAFSEIMSRPI